MVNYSFAKRVKNVPDSRIDFMMNYASRYKDVVSLGQGTPLFPTPSFIYDYLYQQSKTNPTIGMYAGPKIENHLKTLISGQMQQIYGFTPNLEELYLTTGGIAGLFSAFMVFLEKGDEIIYFDPSYPLHLSQIYLTQSKSVFVSLKEEKGWSLDVDKLKKSVTKKTKAIILTNPNNPTGSVLSENEVNDIAKIVVKHNLILILDEAYDFLTYGKKLYNPLKIPEIRNRIVLGKSFSKEFAMTGWRIGYIYAHKKIIEKINNVHVYFSISPPTPSMIAAIVALKDPRGKKAKKEFIKKFKESRQVICQRLDNLPKLFSYHKPDGAYYVFPKIKGFKISSLEFAKLLVDEARVITIPGCSMGPSGEDHLRMSFAADKKVIHSAFDRIDKLAKNHNLF